MKMNKQFFVLLVLFAAVFLLLGASPSTDKQAHEGYGETAVFPNSLMVIEDEAFEGTAFRTLVFKDGFLRMGDRVFSGILFLKEVYLPRSVDYISDTAFSGSEFVKIWGYAGTYVQEWAKRQNIDFCRSDFWYSAPTNVQYAIEKLLAMFFVFCLPVTEDLIKNKRYIEDLAISMRPQDRPELNPIDYRFP